MTSPPAHGTALPLPTYTDVDAASRQIAGIANRTPVLTSRTLDGLTGARVHLKCEQFQRGGAFKFRGAYNALSRLSPDQQRRGVVTFSSGNHAQAIALAGQLLDIPRVIVMPADAPAIKRQATEAYGGEVVLYDRAREDREAIGRRLADERGLTLVPPYDHADVIAGQGTAAKELFDEVGQLDLLLVPCGGGGLLSGSALSARALSPGCRTVGVEPAAGDDATRSFQTRTLLRVDNPQTVADGARSPSLGALTFPLVLANVDDMQTVSEAAIVEAVRLLFYRLKIVVEPTGALAACALLEGRVSVPGKRVGVVLSGGNVDFRWAAETLVRRS
jgi:threonine dehydratase